MHRALCKGFRAAACCLPLLAAAGSHPAIVTAQGADSPAWSEAAVRPFLEEWVDRRRLATGIVVGVVDGEGTRSFSYGRLSRKSSAAPDENTVFEVGSITKVFSGLLLAELAQAGQVRLSDPLARYLPQRVHAPARGGQEITLVDLATQSSGLPWWPPRPPYADPHDPWAHYSTQQLYDALDTTQLARDPGSGYGYSNFGFGVLGQALANRAGMPYPALVRARVAAPLGMKSTAVELTPEMERRLAPGHTAKLREAEHWQMGALGGAGGLHSTAHDLLLFLSAELGLTGTPLASAMAYQVHAVRRPTDTPGMEIALAWRVTHRPRGELVWHSGMTGGFAAFVGFDPASRRGVVVLSDAANEVSGLGLHFLDGAMPLRK